MNPQRAFLSIDTTGRVIDIALSSGKKIINIQRDIRLNHYEGVVGLIESILKRADLGLKQVDYFGVCTGPGSFTGMRIGLSVMKALAYALDKPLIGFGSLDLLAYEAKDRSRGLLCIIQDAKRSNIYSAIFDNSRSLRLISPYLLLDIGSLLKRLRKIYQKPKDLCFYGDASELYGEVIKKSFPKAKFLPYRGTSSKGRAMIALTKDSLNQKKDPFKILPFYMYPRDCQVSKPIK